MARTTGSAAPDVVTRSWHSMRWRAARERVAMSVTGLVLAAGESTRLGRPKQLLPLGSTTLLGRTLQMVASCPLDHVIVVLGAATVHDVRASLALNGIEVV